MPSEIGPVLNSHGMIDYVSWPIFVIQAIDKDINVANREISKYKFIEDWCSEDRGFNFDCSTLEIHRFNNAERNFYKLRRIIDPINEKTNMMRLEECRD